MRKPAANITRQYIEARTQVKQELDAILRAAGPQKKLQHIQKRISELESDVSPKGLVRNYIYAMSALVHHERFGGLSPQGITRLSKFINANLQALGVSHQSRTLSFLYADLHSILSQIHRKEGKHWLAAWEQQTASYLASENQNRDPGFESLLVGTRLLRLGDATQALQHFELAQSLGLSDGLFIRCLSQKLKAHRLMGEISQAKQVFENLYASKKIDPEELKEVQWEWQCTQVQKMDDIRPLIGMVIKGKPHHSPIYLAETFIWTRASQSRQYLSEFPTLRSLVRSSVSIPKRNIYFHFAELFEYLYKEDIPLHLRMQKVNNAVFRIPQLITLDKELLVLAALSRWLVRKRMFPFARILLNNYRSLSFRLTLGKDSDPLGILSDLFDKKWFTEPFHSSVKAA